MDEKKATELLIKAGMSERKAQDYGPRLSEAYRCDKAVVEGDLSEVITKEPEEETESTHCIETELYGCYSGFRKQRKLNKRKEVSRK